MHAGGAFDPLGLGSKDEEQTFSLRTAEIKHGRLAMVAFLGKKHCFTFACSLCCTICMPLFCVAHAHV